MIHMQGSDFKALNLEATTTWQVEHEFCYCRCDIVCIWYNYNFLTMGCNNIQSSSQSVAPGLNPKPPQMRLVMSSLDKSIAWINPKARHK